MHATGEPTCWETLAAYRVQVLAPDGLFGEWRDIDLQTLPPVVAWTIDQNLDTGECEFRGQSYRWELDRCSTVRAWVRDARNPQK